MIRNAALNVRVTTNERQLAEAVAERLERTESDMVRLLVRREAERLGITPTNEQRRPTEAGVRT
jgi:antitoxin component of RelBE/YafQ-DinJ toxin-antitoxin module